MEVFLVIAAVLIATVAGLLFIEYRTSVDNKYKHLAYLIVVVGFVLWVLKFFGIIPLDWIEHPKTPKVDIGVP